MEENEKFTINNNELDFGILDFWKSKYSNIYNMQEVIAEFIVEKAPHMLCQALWCFITISLW